MKSPIMCKQKKLTRILDFIDTTKDDLVHTSFIASSSSSCKAKLISQVWYKAKLCKDLMVHLRCLFLQSKNNNKAKLCFALLPHALAKRAWARARGRRCATFGGPSSAKPNLVQSKALSRFVSTCTKKQSKTSTKQSFVKGVELFVIQNIENPCFTDYTIVRPLINCSRHSITMACILNRLPVYPDITNKKVRYSRNRMRKQVIPSLQFFFNPEVEKALFKFSEFHKNA